MCEVRIIVSGVCKYRSMWEVQINVGGADKCGRCR